MSKLKFDLYLRFAGKGNLWQDELDRSKETLFSFCESNGYLIHKLHIDVDYPGTTTDRTGYQAMIKDMREKVISGVIIAKISDLTRSLSDFAVFIDTLRENNLIFITLEEEIDSTTPSGKSFLKTIRRMTEGMRDSK